jgi:hypothetical protein
MYEYPPAAPPPPVSPARVPWGTAALVVVLGVAGAGLGAIPGPRPRWTGAGGWMVDQVPGSLWALALGTTAVCLAGGLLVVRRAARLCWTAPALAGWVLVVLAAGAALLWRSLYDASLSTIEFGALIPVLDWAFTLVPAVLAGVAGARRGRDARIALALGTGLVTVPAYALGTALVFAGGGAGAAAAALPMVAILGLGGLAGGTALAATTGRRYPDRIYGAAIRP